MATPRFPPWGEVGERPPDNFDYAGGQQVFDVHFNYLWDNLHKLETEDFDSLQGDTHDYLDDVTDYLQDIFDDLNDYLNSLEDRTATRISNEHKSVFDRSYLTHFSDLAPPEFDQPTLDGGIFDTFIQESKPDSGTNTNGLYWGYGEDSFVSPPSFWTEQTTGTDTNNETIESLSVAAGGSYVVYTTAQNDLVGLNKSDLTEAWRNTGVVHSHVLDANDSNVVVKTAQDSVTIYDITDGSSVDTKTFSDAGTDVDIVVDVSIETELVVAWNSETSGGSLQQVAVTEFDGQNLTGGSIGEFQEASPNDRIEEVSTLTTNEFFVRGDVYPGSGGIIVALNPSRVLSTLNNVENATTGWNAISWYEIPNSATFTFPTEFGFVAASDNKIFYTNRNYEVAGRNVYASASSVPPVEIANMDIVSNKMIASGGNDIKIYELRNNISKLGDITGQTKASPPVAVGESNAFYAISDTVHKTSFTSSVQSTNTYSITYNNVDISEVSWLTTRAEVNDTPITIDVGGDTFNITGDHEARKLDTTAQTADVTITFDATAGEQPSRLYEFALSGTEDLGTFDVTFPDIPVPSPDADYPALRNIDTTEQLNER